MPELGFKTLFFNLHFTTEKYETQQGKIACPGYTASRLPFLISGCPTWPHSFCWLSPLFGRVSAYFAQNWSLGLLLPSASNSIPYKAGITCTFLPLFYILNLTSFLFLPLPFSFQFLMVLLVPFKCSLLFSLCLHSYLTVGVGAFCQGVILKQTFSLVRN